MLYAIFLPATTGSVRMFSLRSISMSRISNNRHSTNMKTNLFTKIKMYNSLSMTISLTGNHTVTNVHKSASVMIFKKPKSLIRLLLPKGNAGKEYKKEMAPKTNKIIK